MLEVGHSEVICPCFISFFEILDTKVDTSHIILCRSTESSEVQIFGKLVFDVICNFIISILGKYSLEVIFMRLKINYVGIP